jgi:hypothetical protein
MRVSAESRVRKSIEDMLDAQLLLVLRPEMQVAPRLVSLDRIRELSELSDEAIHRVSRNVAARMADDPSFLKAAAELAGKLEKAWLTTQEAADLSGFSRSFIKALIDGPTYDGEVQRSSGGHRRLRASDFEQWRASLVVDEAAMPKTLSDVRSGVKLGDDPVPGEAEAKARRASSGRALAAARSLGIS